MGLTPNDRVCRLLAWPLELCGRANSWVGRTLLAFAVQPGRVGAWAASNTSHLAGLEPPAIMRAWSRLTGSVACLVWPLEICSAAKSPPTACCSTQARRQQQARVLAHSLQEEYVTLPRASGVPFHETQSQPAADYRVQGWHQQLWLGPDCRYCQLLDPGSSVAFRFAAAKQHRQRCCTWSYRTLRV